MRSTRAPVCSLLATLVLATPVAAVAQVSPTAPAHPGLPWGIGVATPQGQLIRYLYVAPQVVTLDYLMTGALANTPPTEEQEPPADKTADRDKADKDKKDGKPADDTGKGQPTADSKPPEEPPAPKEPSGPQIVRQQVTIPGYYVRETTAGYHYPERWTIEQYGPNAYRWRQIPPQFVPK